MHDCAYTLRVVEWDPDKDESNEGKHGLRFSEATELFTSGVEYLEIFDDAHSNTEDRFIAIGPIARGLVVVVWTERLEDTIRIISARFATASERRMFRSAMEE